MRWKEDIYIIYSYIDSEVDLNWIMVFNILHSFGENFHKETFNGLISRVIQHELDHLKGKLFVDYLSPGKKMLIKKRLLEISKNGSPSTGIIL